MNKKIMKTVLCVAGSDPNALSGLQADTRTLANLETFAASAVTAVTAQDFSSATEIFALTAELLAKQLQVVDRQHTLNALKIGMLANQAIAQVTSQFLSTHENLPAILDPVFCSSAGASLLDSEGIDFMRKQLLPQVTLITPNLAEAKLLTQRSINSPLDMKKAADVLLEMGAKAVLIKGGHLTGDLCVDWYQTSDTSRLYEHVKLDRDARGTGCSLSSAIASYCAWGHPLEKAITRAIDFIQDLIKNSQPLSASGNSCLLPEVRDPFQRALSSPSMHTFKEIDQISQSTKGTAFRHFKKAVNHLETRDYVYLSSEHNQEFISRMHRMGRCYSGPPNVTLIGQNMANAIFERIEQSKTKLNSTLR